MKRLSIIVISFIVAVSAIAQVSVESKIDSITIFIGEQAHITVDVTARRGQKISFPQYKPSQYITQGVEVLEATNTDTSKADNGLIKVSKVYTLTSFDEHLYSIPAIKVNVDGKEYKGNNLALKVITMNVDTLHPDKFFPPKDVQDNPFSWNEWSGMFWLSVLMLLLLAFSYWLFIRLRQNKPIIAKIKIVKKILPHQKALNAINELKLKRTYNTEDTKEYYTKLTDAIRAYIEERFDFNAKEMTSSEIIEHLNYSGNQDMINELRELFQTADLVKFAKYSTLINENDFNLVNAINFIDKTKQEGQPVTEKIVPKLTDKDIHTKKARVIIKSAIFVIIIISVSLLVYVIYNVSQLLIK